MFSPASTLSKHYMTKAEPEWSKVPERHLKAETKKVVLLIATIGLPLILGTVLGVLLAPSLFVSGENNQEAKEQAFAAAKEILSKRTLALRDGAEADLLKDHYDISTTGGLFAYEKEVHRLVYVRAWLEERDYRFEKIDTVYELDDFSEIKPLTYRLELTEHTTYELTGNEDDIVLHFGSRAIHVIEIQKQGSIWRILVDWYCDPLGSGGTPPHEGRPLSKSQTDGVLVSERKSKEARIYDRTKAAAYAVEHSGVKYFLDSGRYNPNYRVYTFAGGDCANFVSQALFAGGLTQGYGWHYQGEGSVAWVRSEDLIWHLLSSGRAEKLFVGSFREAMTEDGVLSPIKLLQIGDVIGYEKKGEIVHVAMVTKKDKYGNPLITSHTADRVNFPWDLGWGKDSLFWFVHIIDE
jgi:hypothetical protein